MDLQFFDSYPCRALEPDPQALLLGARKVDAAMAFVTWPGRTESAGFDDEHDDRTR
jgi:hypothetical protein